jgi:hypothetical protein
MHRKRLKLLTLAHICDNICHMAPATLLLHRRRIFDDGAIEEMKLWQVPTPVRGSDHGFKYSLFHGRTGQRLVCYDNEPGKGDHRHYGQREETYEFTTPEQLIADFLKDVFRLLQH